MCNGPHLSSCHFFPLCSFVNRTPFTRHFDLMKNIGPFIYSRLLLNMFNICISVEYFSGWNKIYSNELILEFKKICNFYNFIKKLKINAPPGTSKTAACCLPPENIIFWFYDDYFSPVEGIASFSGLLTIGQGPVGRLSPSRQIDRQKFRLEK